MRKFALFLAILFGAAFLFGGCTPPTDNLTTESSDGLPAQTDGSPAPVESSSDHSTIAETPPLRLTDDPDAIDRIAGSVVKLEIYDEKDRKIGTGSAFAAFDPAVLVTAAHVIVNMKYALVTTESGSGFRIERAIDGDVDSDVALLALPEDAGLRPLAVSEAKPRRGETVVAIGSQFGKMNLVTTGTFAGVWEFPEACMFVFTAPVASGNSGGPLLNERGEVIGIVSGTYEKGQNLNFASPIEKAGEIYRKSH